MEYSSHDITQAQQARKLLIKSALNCKEKIIIGGCGTGNYPISRQAKACTMRSLIMTNDFLYSPLSFQMDRFQNQ